MSSSFPGRSCVWAPASLAARTNAALSAMALQAADPPSLNQSAWRTLGRRSFSMAMWRSLTPRWWEVLRSCLWSPRKPDASASLGFSPNPSTSALRTSAPRPSGSRQGYRRPPARYADRAGAYIVWSEVVGKWWMTSDLCWRSNHHLDHSLIHLLMKYNKM